MTKLKNKITIVEDDPLIALDLQEVLEEHGYEILGVYHSGEKALEEINAKTDLALLDINLEGLMNGIELGLELKKKKIPVIFITSYYDEKILMKAKDADPMAYIIKPFEEHDVIANIKLAMSKMSNDGTQKTQAEDQEKPVFVKANSKMVRIIPEDIQYIEAYDIYSNIFIDGKRITVSHTLKNIHEILNFPFLIRVHRSFIININKVKSICDDEIMIDDYRVPIGRTYKKEFFDAVRLV